MSIQLYPITNPKKNWADFYIESAKNRFKKAKGFWKRKSDKNYIKLLYTTYHPVSMASKFFKSIGRIIQGIFLLIWAVFNNPTISFPKILGGIGLESLALLINIFNVFLFFFPDIIGIIGGIIFNLIS